MERGGVRGVREVREVKRWAEALQSLPLRLGEGWG